MRAEQRCAFSFALDPMGLDHDVRHALLQETSCPDQDVQLGSFHVDLENIGNPQFFAGKPVEGVSMLAGVVHGADPGADRRDPGAGLGIARQVALNAL
jgi:hypothetical protein